MSRMIRMLITGLTVLVLLTANITSVFAAYFKTIPLPPQEQEAFCKGREFEPITQPPSDLAIYAMDVSTDDLIALGFRAMPRAYVVVYDSEFNFLYGCQFKDNGEAFGIDFLGNELVIYFARGDEAVTLDSSGCWKSVEEVPDNQLVSSDAVWKLREEGTLADGTYVLERDTGPLDAYYSRLVSIDAEGHRTILYDASRAHNIRYFTVATIIVIWTSICVGYKIYEFWKKYNEEMG